MTRLAPNTIRLYHRGTPAGHETYPVKANERISRTQTGVWERRVVTGPVTADAEQLISSWTQDDYSGGFGIKDGNESTDTARIAFGIIDGRRPKSMCLPPKTTVIPPPSWATGAAYPLGDIGTNFYVGFENGVAGWDDDNDDWYAHQNTWPASFEIFNEAVSFCGALVVPGGDSASAAVLQESGAGTGTLTVTSSGAELSAVCLHDGKLWGYNEGTGILGSITVPGALADFTDPANWGLEKDAFGNYVLLDPELHIRDLINFYNSAQQETLWAITRGHGTYLWDPGQPKWIKGTVKDGAHPDWGIAADVFRDGEDLFIAGGGLDLTRFTTSNVEVPLSGPSKDQGVPPAYQGNIVDLCSERSTLYALVKAGVVPTPINQTVWMDQVTIAGGPGGTTGPLQFNDPDQIAVDSDGNLYVADGGNNRLLKLDEDGAYVSAINSLTGVSGVCLDASDNVYVVYTDAGVTTFRKYNSSLISQWTETTALTNTGHMATDGTSIYVVVANGVLVLDASDGSVTDTWGDVESGFTLVATYGSTGSGTSPNFDGPEQMAVDSLGNIYIADWANNRLVKLDANGGYLTSVTSLTHIYGVAVDASDNIYVTYGTDNIRKYNSALTTQWTVTRGSNLRHCAHDGTFLWVCDFGANEVVKVNSATGADALGDITSSSVWSIAYHASELYVLPPNLNLVKVYNMSGVFQRQWAVSLNTSAVAVDENGLVLVTDADGGVYRTTNTGIAIDTFASSGANGIVTKPGGVVYINTFDTDTIEKWESSLASGPGSADGEFTSPYGIAYSTFDDAVFVVDTGNDRVQRFDASTGAFEAKWTVGDDAKGATCEADGDVWVAEYANNRVRLFSNAGAVKDTISQSVPIGVALSGANVWVTAGQHNATEWAEEEVELGSSNGRNWLAAWSGTAWYGLWESDAEAAAPTWMRVAFNGQYALWWGDADGNCYRQLLPPPFFNPAARMEFRVYPFQSYGWMETIRYDAAMSGWDKIASHAFAMMDYADPSNYVDVSYRTDADQFTSGSIDPEYRPWKRVDHIGRTLMWFDDEEDDPISGLPWHEGEPFQWIQFKFEFYGDEEDEFTSPVWMWHSLHHLSVPQDSASFVIKIPLNNERSIDGRSPNEMAQTLRSLQTTRALVHLQTGNPRPGNPEWQVFFRGRVTQVKSEFHAGANNNLDEILVVNFVEVGASSNEHTIVAP